MANANRGFISYKVDNDRAVALAIRKAAKIVNDFSIPFRIIGNDFFKSNEEQLTLKGPGKYPDLSPAYKKEKKKAVGHVYPILVRTSRLLNSLTIPHHSDAVFLYNKKSLVLGTSVPYAAKHQFGLEGMPIRKPVFIDGGPKSGKGRRGRWINIIEAHVKRVIKHGQF